MRTSLSSGDGTPTESARGIPEIPDYELLRWIGGGAYGEVWLARGVTGAYRAVKVVWREDFELDRTFEREFEGIRHFEPVSRRHEGVVDIYHVGRNGKLGFYYCVMELADDVFRGQNILPEKYIPKTLSQVMRDEGDLGWRVCRDAGVALARALDHLHQNGLTHRDVKPSNVIFVEGKPKLADIGLVAGAGEMGYVGTDGYVPREGAGMPAADMFSLGKVLYEMSTGFDRMEFPAVPGTRLESPDAAKWRELNEIICKACAPLAKNRFASAAAMAAALDGVGEAVVPVSLVPPISVIGGFCTLAMGAMIAWLGSGGGEIAMPAPRAPEPVVVAVEVEVPEVEERESEKVPVLSSEDLAKHPRLKEVWKNSLGIEFDPDEESHVSRHAVEAKIFNTYVDETQRALEGEVISLRNPGEGGGEGTAVRHVMAVPPEDALAFCRWMENKDRTSGYLTADHFYDIRRFEDYGDAVDGGVSGPRDPGNIAFRCVVAKRDYGALRIDSDPPGAEVIFRGRAVGVTPYQDRAVPIGRARYEVRKEGYRVGEVSGVVRSEGVLDLVVALEKTEAVAMGRRWRNGLGMDFVPVGGILFSAYETRVSEYEAFVNEVERRWSVGSDSPLEPDHPATWVNRDDAEAFCRWLTGKERKGGLLGKPFRYRLPTDEEWSAAVELPLEKGDSPASRNQKIVGVYPWGYEWPPPPGAGNLADGSSGVGNVIPGYLDLFAYTAPVGSFRPNELGIYDLAGNVWEWVSGEFGGEAEKYRNFAVVRGGSWVNAEQEKLLSSCRNAVPPDLREPLYGFRAVIAEE